MWSTVAWAQEGASAAQPGFIDQFLIPMALMFFVLYFLIFRPQQKRAKAHQEFLKNLKRGDQVLTSGGIFGTIEGLTEGFVILEIADDVKIRILKAQISSSVQSTNEDKKS